MPATDPRRAFVITMRAAFEEYCQRTQNGSVAPADVTFALAPPHKPTQDLTADVAYFAKDHIPAEANDGGKVWHTAPDVVVLVAALGQKKATLAPLAQQWLAVSAKLVWVAWPEAKQFVAWRSRFASPTTLGSGDVLEDADLLPDFSLSIADLF